MCRDNFWKRIIAFCLTFWLGAFVSNFFVSKQSTAIPEGKETITGVIITQKDCIADENLNYQLIDKEEAAVPVSVKKEKEKTIVGEGYQRNSKESRPVTGKENSKTLEELERKFSERGYKYRNLLHKEHCYDSNAEK